MSGTKRQGSAHDEKQLEDLAFVAGHTRYLNRNEKTQWTACGSSVGCMPEARRCRLSFGQ